MSISCFDPCSRYSERVTAIGSGFELSEKKRVDLSFFVSKLNLFSLHI